VLLPRSFIPSVFSIASKVGPDGAPCCDQKIYRLVSPSAQIEAPDRYLTPELSAKVEFFLITGVSQANAAKSSSVCLGSSNKSG
jgi:hypothetical protein